MTQSNTDNTRQIGAYTLVEMMVVMVILIVVMALVAPVIGNARNAAKRTNTQQLLSNLSQASQQFELDNRRTPGYFSETEMGSTQNSARGFTGTENVLLDLAGGRVDVTGNPPTDAIQVGPTPTATAYVRVGLIGAPTQTKGVVNKGYFIPDPKFFALQDTSEKKAASVADHFLLPDLVDGFGQPILTWRQDIEPAQSLPFASRDSATRASFYWASNAAFINATKLGKKEQDQTAILPGQNGSLLSFNDNEVTYTMNGLLGNPAFPASARDAQGREVPAAARGKLVFHSAGTDGVYLGIKDRGGIIATATGTPPNHVQNVVDFRSGRDPLDNFDDVISVAGN